MTLIIDRCINLCKWPIAFLALYCFIPAVRCAARVGISIYAHANQLGPFLLGLFGYLLLWQLFFRKRSAGSFFSTLEHECTHAIVALLTLHGVTGMRVTWNKGGHIRYIGGEGNWLITIAPYFIPTISIIAVIVAALVPQQHSYTTQLLIGASVGFHLGSSYLETHDAQSDLIKVGYSFCCCFLPTANLLVYTFLLAFIWKQGAGIVHTWDQFLALCYKQFKWIVMLIDI